MNNLLNNKTMISEVCFVFIVFLSFFFPWKTVFHFWFMLFLAIIIFVIVNKKCFISIFIFNLFVVFYSSFFKISINDSFYMLS